MSWWSRINDNKIMEDYSISIEALSLIRNFTVGVSPEYASRLTKTAVFLFHIVSSIVLSEDLVFPY